jgi:hypothetical protein
MECPVCKTSKQKTKKANRRLKKRQTKKSMRSPEEEERIESLRPGEVYLERKLASE